MGRSISEGGRAGRASDGGWVEVIWEAGVVDGVVVIFFEGPQETRARIRTSARMRGWRQR